MQQGWIEIDHRSIAAGTEDEPVIVWHVYHGVMVEKRFIAAKNRFMTHWRDIDNAAWIDAGQRRPTRADADIYKCVISLNRWGEASTAGWHRFAHEADLIAWQPTPEPPEGFDALRKAVH